MFTSVFLYSAVVIYFYHLSLSYRCGGFMLSNVVEVNYCFSILQIAPWHLNVSQINLMAAPRRKINYRAASLLIPQKGDKEISQK